MHLRDRDCGADGLGEWALVYVGVCLAEYTSVMGVRIGMCYLLMVRWPEQATLDWAGSLTGDRGVVKMILFCLQCVSVMLTLV
jgi:hypothetical protein